jgi:hypothetical protein
MFIIHLFPLVLLEIYLYAGIIAKSMQNSGENGQRMQVDMVGGLGPTWWRRPAPQCATLALSTSLIRGSCSTSSPMRWPQVGSRWRVEEEHHADRWCGMAAKPTWRTKSCTYPHSTSPMGPLHIRRRAQWVASRPGWGTEQRPLALHHLYFSHMQRNMLRTNPMCRFMAVTWWFDPTKESRCHTDRWRGIGVALTPP